MLLGMKGVFEGRGRGVIDGRIIGVLVGGTDVAEGEIWGRSVDVAGRGVEVAGLDVGVGGRGVEVEGRGVAVNGMGREVAAEVGSPRLVGLGVRVGERVGVRDGKMAVATGVWVAGNASVIEGRGEGRMGVRNR